MLSCGENGFLSCQGVKCTQTFKMVSNWVDDVTMFTHNFLSKLSLQPFPLTFPVFPMPSKIIMRCYIQTFLMLSPELLHCTVLTFHVPIPLVIPGKCSRFGLAASSLSVCLHRPIEFRPRVVE